MARIFSVYNINNGQVYVCSPAMNYSLDYKGIEGSSCGANTASEEFLDSDMPAALRGILPGARLEVPPLLSLPFFSLLKVPAASISFGPAPKLLTSGG